MALGYLAGLRHLFRKSAYTIAYEAMVVVVVVTFVVMVMRNKGEG